MFLSCLNLQWLPSVLKKKKIQTPRLGEKALHAMDLHSGLPVHPPMTLSPWGLKWIPSCTLYSIPTILPRSYYFSFQLHIICHDLKSLTSLVILPLIFSHSSPLPITISSKKTLISLAIVQARFLKKKTCRVISVRDLNQHTSWP